MLHLCLDVRISDLTPSFDFLSLSTPPIFFLYLFCERQTDIFTSCTLRTHYPPGPSTISPVAAQSPASSSVLPTTCRLLCLSSVKWEGGEGVDGAVDGGIEAKLCSSEAQQPLSPCAGQAQWWYEGTDSVEQDWQDRMETGVHRTVKRYWEDQTKNIQGTLVR